MSDHIKTGVVIPAKLALSSLPDKQWVSLSWLREQIQNESKIIRDDTTEGKSYIECLQWFLSLLEQEEKKQ